MKKPALLPLLFLPFSLFSCQGQEEQEGNIPLFHSDLLTYTLPEGTADYLFNLYSTSELEAAMGRKESFFVYVYAAGCGTCDTLGLLVKSFVRKNNAVVPFMFLPDYRASEGALDLSETSFLFYEEGVLTDTISDFSSVGSEADLEELLSPYLYDTGVTIDNTLKLESNLRTTYNLYHIADYVFGEESDSDYIYLAEEGSLTEENVLFLKDQNYAPDDLYSFLKEKEVTRLAYVSAQTDSTTFEEYYHFAYRELTSPYTLVTYSTEEGTVTPTFTTFETLVLDTSAE